MSLDRAIIGSASHRMEGLPWKSATLYGTGPQRTGVNSIAGSRRMPLSARRWRPDLSLWRSPDFLPDQMTRTRRAIASAVAWPRDAPHQSGISPAELLPPRQPLAQVTMRRQ